MGYVLLHFWMNGKSQPPRVTHLSLPFDLLRQRWGKLIDADPAWNPNLALNGANIGLVSPPYD